MFGDYSMPPNCIAVYFHVRTVKGQGGGLEVPSSAACTSRRDHARLDAGRIRRGLGNQIHCRRRAVRCLQTADRLRAAAGLGEGARYCPSLVGRRAQQISWSSGILPPANDPGRRSSCSERCTLPAVFHDIRACTSETGYVRCACCHTLPLMLLLTQMRSTRLNSTRLLCSRCYPTSCR